MSSHHARRLAATLASLVLAACATPAPYSGGDIYLARYRPIDAPPGGVVVSLTASLKGELAVRNGCFIVTGPGGSEPTLPVFRGEQVRIVTLNGRLGIEDTTTGETAYTGDIVSMGGGSMERDAAYDSTRLIAPPPVGCPTLVFGSNGGFERAKR